jgi:hypothetical protein
VSLLNSARAALILAQCSSFPRVQSFLRRSVVDLVLLVVKQLLPHETQADLLAKVDDKGVPLVSPLRLLLFNRCSSCAVWLPLSPLLLPFAGMLASAGLPLLPACRCPHALTQSCFVLPCPQSLVVKYLNAHMTLWEEVPKHWVRFSEYFLFLHEFATLGAAQRKVRAACRLV